MQVLSLRSPLLFHPTRTLSSMATMKPLLRGIVFDMDGTLTVPVIDFPAMYKAVLGEQEYAKASAGIDILHHIESWSPDNQKRAYQVIADYEKAGLDRLQIMPGASQLCGFLDSRNIRRGLITRNVKDAVDLFHMRFGVTLTFLLSNKPGNHFSLLFGLTFVTKFHLLLIIFSPALSREFRPYKPDPAPLLHICSIWGIQPQEVMMIGDSLKDDVACGKRAGAFSCLLDETGRYDSPEYQNVEFKPDYKVSSLVEVQSVLEKDFILVP